MSEKAHDKYAEGMIALRKAYEAFDDSEAMFILAEETHRANIVHDVSQSVWITWDRLPVTLFTIGRFSNWLDHGGRRGKHAKGRDLF